LTNGNIYDILKIVEKPIRGANMEQKKKLLSDSIWSVAGLVFMNVALQFAVYPLWERRVGEAALGNILYLMSLMNVFAVSLGLAVNYARLRQDSQSPTKNSPYIGMLLGTSVIAFGAAILLAFFGGVKLSLTEIILFGVLTVITMWRFYADVEYKLYLNYKSFFFYYLFIGGGYIIGIALFYITGLWPLTLLVGEVFGLLYVVIRGSVFRIDAPLFGEGTGDLLKLVAMLCGSEFISNLIFNADRIMLKSIIDEVAVTEFYLSSLLGKTIALLTIPLGGVVIGYLTKYKGDLSLKAMNLIFVGAVGIVVLATAACTVGSYIVIPILYPDQFADIKRYFIVNNLSQVLYFIANVATVILLRFAKSRYQIYVNVTYAVSFLAICIPAGINGGFWGFCLGLLATCAIRFTVSIGLGYFSVLSARRKARRQNV
jgi:O-antigen/teichoic acid export membrane protein